jgi:hypothetical protein
MTMLAERINNRTRSVLLTCHEMSTGAYEACQVLNESPSHVEDSGDDAPDTMEDGLIH